MPLTGGRYRVRVMPNGTKVRLHFGKGGAVDEAKNLKTGATHTPSEFAADRRHRRRTATGRA